MTHRTIHWARKSFVQSTAFLILVSIVRADPPGPVTACVSDTQTGAGVNLAQALHAGGVIRFACPAGTVIRVTGRYVLGVSTLIEGGDIITLDGRGSFGPMLTSSQNVILRRLTVRGFAQKKPRVPEPGAKSIGRITGSVLAARGDAELDRATIETSDFPIHVRGIATVTDSTFVGNRGGLTLSVDGIARIENSRFAGNLHELSIGAGWVRRCSFNGQTGAALSVHHASGAVEIRHSTFSGIRGGPAVELSQRAGTNGPQTIKIRANVFRDNDGGPSAGAIAVYDSVQKAKDRGAPASVIKVLSKMPPASFVLGYNRFLGNRGARGGAMAADLAHSGGMVSTGDLFTDNAAGGDGGAVAASGGPLQIGHALFKSNRAGGRGAALVMAPDGSVAISNSLVIRNTGPEGAIAGNSVTLTNVTVADNLATGFVSTAAARAGNNLLARNRPADCSGIPASAFHGGGLQSDGSCPGVPVGDAFLDPFYVPAANSPALTAGDVALCRGVLVGGFDLLFQGRINRSHCALGAFERPPLRVFSPKTEQQPVHADPKDEFFENDPYRPPPSGGTQTPSSPGYPTPPAPSYQTPPPRGYPAPSLPPPYQTRRANPPASRAKPPASTGARNAPRTVPSPAQQRIADAAEAMDGVLAALKAEEASPIERVRVFITRGAFADEYFIDRVNPGRFRVLINPRQGGPERIIVDKMQWVRTSPSEPWFKTPAEEIPGAFPSMADLFRNGLSNVTAKAGPGGTRNIEGTLTWTNGPRCEGQVLLRIDSAGLPLLLRFEGLCGNKPLRFVEAFSFTGPVTITAPQ